MRLSTPSVRVLQATFTAVFLASCQNGAGVSAGGAQAPGFTPASQRVHGPMSVVAPHRLGVSTEGRPLPGWMKLAPAGTAKGYAYVSQFGLTDVNQYAARNQKNAPPLCQISGQPFVNGIAVDSSKNVWIPQGGEMTGTTTEFAPNCGKALFSIPDTDGQPAAIAFDRKHDAYIENIMGANGPPGNIDVYAPGKKKTLTVLQDSSAFLWFDLALDSKDNVFMVYSDVYNKGHVVEFAGGKNSPAPLPMSLGFPGGLTFDTSGNLLVVDQDAVNVSVFKPPFTGKPIGTFSLQGDSIPCRFARGGKLLYCSDFVNGSVDVYAYDPSKPSATKYSYSFTNGIQHGSENAGIALSPAAPN